MRCSARGPYSVGRPPRGSSWRPGSPLSANRVRHLLTVVVRTPSRRAILLEPSPAAAARTTLGRNANRCSVLGARSQRSNFPRSSSVTWTTVATCVRPGDVAGEVQHCQTLECVQSVPPVDGAHGDSTARSFKSQATSDATESAFSAPGCRSSSSTGIALRQISTPASANAARTPRR